MKLKNLNLSIITENGEAFFNIDIPEIAPVEKVETPSVKTAPPITNTTTPQIEPSKYNFGRINAGNIGLNVREKPDTNSPVVAGLQTGQRFKIVAKVGAWYQICEPVKGYIFAEYTTVSDDTTTVSQALVNFTASYEGFSPTAYQDAGGKWTIGYGFCYGDIKPNFTLTEAQAKTILENKLNEYAMAVSPLTAGLNLNKAEFDALVDFAYNLGVDSLKDSDLLANIKTCCNNEIITQDFLAWDHCDGVVLPGLKKRRQNEAVLFITGQYINN